MRLLQGKLGYPLVSFLEPLHLGLEAVDCGLLTLARLLLHLEAVPQLFKVPGKVTILLCLSIYEPFQSLLPQLGCLSPHKHGHSSISFAAL